MKQRIAIAAASFALIGGVFLGAASSSVDAAPSQKACFGQDRAAWIHDNSGAEWGAIAPERAGENAAINAAYKACQG